MRPTFWQRLDVLARQLTPFGLTFLLVIIGLIPLPIPGLVAVAPLLPLIAVYHWAVSRPDLFPAYVVFIIGVMQDLLSGGVLGLNAVVLLSVYGVVLWQRRFLAGKSFIIVWLGFTLIAAAAVMLNWVMGSLFAGALLHVKMASVQYAVTLGVYPAVAWLFLRWQRAFLRHI